MSPEIKIMYIGILQRGYKTFCEEIKNEACSSWSMHDNKGKYVSIRLIVEMINKFGASSE